MKNIKMKKISAGYYSTIYKNQKIDIIKANFNNYWYSKINNGKV